MYTVVFFKNEDTVDAVPSHWVQNNLCAWPKKNIKKSIKYKLQPNDVEYDYFPVRVLKKNIVTLQEARTKAKIAEITSDLDHEVIRKQIRNRDSTTSSMEIPNPPTYTSDTNEIDCDNKTAINKHSDDTSGDPSFHLSERNDLFLASPVSCDKLNNVSSYNTNQRPSKSHKDDNLNKRVRRHLNFEDKSSYDKSLNLQTIDKPSSSSSLRPLNCNSSTPHIQESHGKYSIPRSRAYEDNYIIHTPSSPFKVTNYDVSRSPIEEFQSSASSTKTKNVTQNNLKLLKATTTSTYKRPLQNEDNATKRCNTLDIMQKILRTILKTKDYVEANGERLDKIESFLYNSTPHHNQNSYNVVETENIFAEYFPILNEDLLSEFETKLSERTFRSNVTNEIKHYSKKDLVPTVREILRQMFHDELLKSYSYVGQKGKKNFSSLGSCTVIIEAVKKMSAHKEATNAQIAAPIKTYLSGATSRLFEKSKNVMD